MEHQFSPWLIEDLTRQVQQRTQWRVRNLAIEVYAERAVLRGEATTLFTRQLAQQVVQDHLPHLTLENSIGVDCPAEFLPGIPLH